MFPDFKYTKNIAVAEMYPFGVTIPAGYRATEFRPPAYGETVLITYRGQGKAEKSMTLSEDQPRIILEKIMEIPGAPQGVSDEFFKNWDKCVFKNYFDVVSYGRVTQGSLYSSSGKDVSTWTQENTTLSKYFLLKEKENKNG